MERAVAEKLLIALEERGYPFPTFKYCKTGGRLKQLGKGGSAVVYELYNTDDTDKHYAMKVIGLSQNKLTTEEFWKTVNIQNFLCDNSPYVVRSIAGKELCVWVDDEGNLSDVQEEYDVEHNEGKMVLQFILMEKLDDILVKGGFHQAMARREELKEEKEVLKLAVQISQALHVAHENNILHRDIKLENIFWDEKENCYKLGDFGISKLTESGTAETVVFSEGYGAPEISQRMADSYNQTADIYSLGISLYLLLNNMKFPGSEGYYYNRVQYDPEFVFPAPENASGYMTRIVRKMCSYWREDRYQSVAEVLSDLEEVGKTADVPTDKEESEYMDLETLTFTEDKETALFDEGRSEEPDDCEALEESQKADAHEASNEYKQASIEKNRYQRRKDKKLLEKFYKEDIIKFFLGFAVLFTLLFRGTQTDSSIMFAWQFLALPIVVFVEAILLKVKEFHITFGMATILFGVYCMGAIGINVPQVALIMCVLTGIPAVVSAAALATGAWMVLVQTGDFAWLMFIREHNLSWIFVVLLLAVLYGVVVLRWDSDKLSEMQVCIWSCVFWLLPIVMIVAGFILERRNVLPELIGQLYLVRSGIILLVLRGIGWYRNVV